MQYHRAEMSTSRKSAQLASLLLAAVFGTTLGACGPHSEYRINKVCKRYCQRAFDCNDTTVYEDCLDECVDTANGCESESDVEAALDILEDCEADSCNQVGTCTVEAWLECNL
jgi:hypothetical protein